MFLLHKKIWHHLLWASRAIRMAMASSTPVSVSMINFFTMVLACNSQSLEGFMSNSKHDLFHQLQCEDVLFPTLLCHPLIVVTIAKTITASVVSKLEIRSSCVSHDHNYKSYMCSTLYLHDHCKWRGVVWPGAFEILALLKTGGGLTNANILGGLDKMFKCTISAGPRHIYPFKGTLWGGAAP